MEAVENSEYDPEHKYYNEARFMRAYYHFILAQAWGDVPKKDHSTKTPEEVMSAATPQYELLKWVASEMEACLPLAAETLENAPSRVVKVTMQGILARVYLFMAGASIEGNEAFKSEYYGKARDFAWEVIKSARGLEGAASLNIQLNPSYSQVFINMIKDTYDKTYNESLWEVDFSWVTVPAPLPGRTAVSVISSVSRATVRTDSPSGLATIPMHIITALSNSSICTMRKTGLTRISLSCLPSPRI